MNHIPSKRRRERVLAFRNALLALILTTPGIPAANAACTFADGVSTQTYTFDIPTINVPRDAAVGSVVYASPRQQAQPATGSYATCVFQVSYSYGVTGAPLVANMSNTYATSVPGIGIRFFDSKGPGGGQQYWGPNNTGSYTGSGSETHSANGGDYYGIELVVTGAIGPGTITPTASGVYSLGGLTISVLQTTSGQIVAQTCQVITDPNIDLPEIAASALSSTGSTAGRTRFDITLANCPPQLHAIQYRLDAPGGVINAAAGTFSVSETSTVKGVDLMVTDDSDNPFALGTAHTLSQYNPSTGGTYPIGFNLKYYRTGAVSAGMLQGQLTYTVSYQ
ncbi:fimbrial protein [Paraburkholderia caribensis]|uniref:fimbrial protein n=1 Tax=Paraburkholderia caribensis TaxID=75105 RepID=UPI00078EC444|nr:fimbrial protein [Paraburkholderia caribensis]AMV46690.1 hypothetical protein ATN79_32605 [Paraburkholderia caribensis]